ncbi:DUF3450 domain-containing protein [Kordiimonas sp. SCSIO 12610]|uniref:DUF3450 domain-containing protein n=1 Tax=Kordiimonas sp. SCSIO 12610 TaxID=2829597 RepID=UPI002108CA1F|nr:DUF3450 domain-containing protein [Kordiimonas sp. SCSIO 12610]UTW55896.1 DUF3450 domain-containing protein [Kordiimonas sp. SCSIO 12610]
MDKAKVKRIAVSTLAVASIVLGAGLANAQDPRLKSVIDEVDESNKIAQASQQTIDGISDATSRIFGDYKASLKENAGLRAYNTQQQRVIDRQLAEINKIKTSIGQIDEIKRQITPLMLRMIDQLEDFVSIDTPFQIDDRKERVAKLRDYMDDPNISDPERFRLVLEEYKREVQYGRTINAYEGSLDDGRSVNFVRLGRVGFYYQTKDGSETAIWDKTNSTWVTNNEYQRAVRQLRRMAGNTVQKDVLVLPVAAPTQGN